VRDLSDLGCECGCDEWTLTTVGIATVFDDDDVEGGAAGGALELATLTTLGIGEGRGD
jgi:hypothetical protein